MSHSDYSWFYQEEHYILVVAVGFGWGPKIAAENLLLDMKVVEEDEVKWRETGLDELAGLVEVRLLLNFGVLCQIPEFDCERRVWVDCVDWLRTTLPPDIKNYDLLLREAFFPSQPSADKGDPTKWHAIQPLIRTLPRGEVDPDLILLSFGGVKTPYSTDVHKLAMPHAFLQGVKACLEQMPTKRVLAFVPDDLLALCKGDASVEHARLTLRKAERKGFMEAMQTCSLLICQPGLYTPFEAMEMKVPFVLTYPMSFTQSRQGRKYVEMKVPMCSAPWDELADAGDAEDIEVIEKAWFVESERAWLGYEPKKICELVRNWINKYIFKKKTKITFHKNETKLVIKIIPIIWYRQKNGDDYVKQRFSTEDVSNNPLFFDIKNPKNCRMAIEQLEDCVKNGRLYQAAEISDQLTYFGTQFLEKNSHLRIRVKIERLKRCSYLNFREYEVACRENLLSELNVIKKDNGFESDGLRFYLFTVIGTPLWREFNEQNFLADLKRCGEICERMKNLIHKRILLAFFYGLEGRKAWFEKKSPSEIVKHFEKGINECLDEHPRTVLHLIILCQEHLIEFFHHRKFSSDEIESAKKLFEEKVIQFRDIRLAKDRIGSTLLNLRALMLHLKFLSFQEKHVSLNEMEYKKNLLKEMGQVKVNLWFAIRRAGLNELKPAPNLLAEIQNLIIDQNLDFVDAQDSVVLASLIKKIDWADMEKIAAIYMRLCGYEVEEMPEGFPAIDLICTYIDGLGRETKTGVQVKHYEEPLREENYKSWIDKLALVNKAKRKKLTHFHFFVKKRANWMNEDKVNNILKGLLKSLVTKIEFTTPEVVAEKIIQHPSCLPDVLAIINLSIIKKDLTEKPIDSPLSINLNRSI